VTAVVSKGYSRFAIDADESSLALDAADLLAQEEAVQGGGVCFTGLAPWHAS
jgi:hypothetical protein